MLTPQKFTYVSQIFLAAALTGLAGCGSGSQSASSGNFAGTVAPSIGAEVTSVSLTSSHVIGGVSTEVTITLAQPAPEGGVEVQLTSSDVNTVTVPSTVRVPAGETSAVAALLTSGVSDVTKVGISAAYGDSVAGTSLSVTPAAAPASTFSVAVTPSSVGIAPGHPGSTEVTTTVPSGFKHALTLTASNLPAGVSVTFTPTPIPSPGAGSAKAVIAVQSSVKVGTYSLRFTASDGTTSESTTQTLRVIVKNAGAKFQGCWYHQNGDAYQGVNLSVANPGTYPFNATLYFGSTCNPNNWADEFGYGTPLNFGSFDYTFWFADFHDQTDTSAIWQVGNSKSVCVNYTTAPDC